MTHSIANYGVCTSWRDVEDIKQDIRGGDKLDFRRKGYTHVGIAGDKGDVLHFSGEPKRKIDAVFRCDLLKDVADGDKVRINNTLDRRLKPLPPKKIVKKARRAVGTGEGTYNLWSNNCEHTATDMRYGEPESEQITTLEKVAVGVVGVGALAVGAIAGLCYLLSDSKKDSDDDDDDDDRRYNKHR